MTTTTRTAWWNNTETWTARNGTTDRLEDLDHTHRANILAWIFRRIEHIRFEESLRWAVEVGLHDGGDAAHDALERELYFVEESSREEFFDSLPLVKRLRELNDRMRFEYQISGNSSVTHIIDTVNSKPAKRSGRRAVCGRYVGRYFEPFFKLQIDAAGAVNAIRGNYAAPCVECEEALKKVAPPR